MMAKCQICKKHEAIYAWQPDLGNGVREIFYCLGSHIRGFMVVKVCDDCRKIIRSGGNVFFTYRGINWWTQGDRLANTTMCPYQ